MISEVKQFVGVLSVSLHIPSSQSLKDKRRVLKSIKDRVRAKFNASVAELGGQETWQRAVLGFAMISNDHQYLEEASQGIVAMIEGYDEAYICEKDFKIS